MGPQKEANNSSIISRVLTWVGNALGFFLLSPILLILFVFFWLDDRSAKRAAESAKPKNQTSPAPEPVPPTEPVVSIGVNADGVRLALNPLRAVDLPAHLNVLFRQMEFQLDQQQAQITQRLNEINRRQQPTPKTLIPESHTKRLEAAKRKLKAELPRHWVPGKKRVVLPNPEEGQDADHVR